jgi:hypothetical protein
LPRGPALRTSHQRRSPQTPMPSSADKTSAGHSRISRIGGET